MTEISVIGLGPMGAALTRALLKNGYTVSIWNRTSAKAEPLIREGAVAVSDVEAVVEASPVIIVCIADYAPTYELLDRQSATQHLAGKIVVQLSTGSPNDARGGARWAQSHQIDYLDGAILAVPSQIGKPESTIYVSGASGAYERSAQMLKSMAGNVMYLGEAPGAASAWDLAFLSLLYGSLIGFYHGANFFAAEGLDVRALGTMLSEIAPAIGEMIAEDSIMIQRGIYTETESTVKTSALAAELLVRQAGETGINAEFPNFVSMLFRRALVSGYEHEGVAALFKVLRNA